MNLVNVTVGDEECLNLINRFSAAGGGSKNYR